MKIAMLFYNKMTPLDTIGPYQVFTAVPGWEVVTVARHAGPVIDETGRALFNAEASIDDIDSADVLFIGGAGNTSEPIDDPDVLAWIRKIDATTQWTTSVCTGSLILGSAGLLQGRNATTHWSALHLLTELGATPVAERVVTDGKYVTGAGVAAGIDMALTFVGQVVGDDMARCIQLGIEYDPEPPYDAGSPKTASEEIVELTRAAMTSANSGSL